MLISVYDNSLTSPRSVTSLIKVTRSGVLGKTKTALSSSAVALNFSGRITQRHAVTDGQRNYFIDLRTNICVEFKLYVPRHTTSTHGEDTHAILGSNLLCPISKLHFFFFISPFGSAICLLLLYETSQICFLTFVISLCTSVSINSLSTQITLLRFIAWFWSGCSFLLLIWPFVFLNHRFMF